MKTSISLLVLAQAKKASNDVPQESLIVLLAGSNFLNDARQNLGHRVESLPGLANVFKPRVI